MKKLPETTASHSINIANYIFVAQVLEDIAVDRINEDIQKEIQCDNEHFGHNLLPIPIAHLLKVELFPGEDLADK